MKMAMFRRQMTRAAILALCTTALSTVPMMAQDNSAPPQQQDQAGPQGGRNGGPGREERQVEFLTKKLNLTSDQVTQVKAIDDSSRQQMMAVHSDTSIAQADKRAKMMDIHKASQAKIRAVLTPEQATKYDALQAQMQERRQSRDGGQGAPAPPQQ